MFPGIQNAVRSGVGLLGMHPSASLTHQLHQSGLSGQRMPGLLPLDVRPSLLQPGAAARFPLLMQQGPAQQATGLLDNSLQAQVRPRTPFPQLDPFNRAPSLNNENVSKTGEESSTGADEGKDQDYRFPPMEKQSTGLLRTPPPEHRDTLGGVGGAGPAARPPLLQTPGTQPARSSLVGRLQALAGFPPDSRWSQARGDFDERDGMRGGPQAAGGPKGFQDEHPTPGQNFSNRFDNRPGAASVNAGHVGGPQPWTRSGGAAAPFDTELNQDLDDRRRPWERQRDRDERDFDFRREVNGNRHSREREHDRGRERGKERTREHDRDKDRDNERDRERGGWTPLLPLPTPLLPTPPLNPNLTLNQGKTLAPLKLNPQIQTRYQSPLFTQGQTRPPLLGLTQSLPQVQKRSPAPLQNQASTSVPQSDTPALAETSQTQSPPSTHSPKPLPEDKGHSTLTKPSTQSSAEQETLPQTRSPPQVIAQVPLKTTSSPETPSHASPLAEASSQDSTVAFTQADRSPEEPTQTLEKQEHPQIDEESQEGVSSPQPQWASGAEKDSVSVAEPTPEASPGPSPDPAYESLLPKRETEPQEEQVPSPKDLGNEQSEPTEEAPSQPVLDTVTDTEGT